MYAMWNPSPRGAKVGDCAIRALAKALNVDWETAYTMLAVKGFEMADMPNSNAVIHAVLSQAGFDRQALPNTCPNCYTVAQFAEDHPSGVYVLGTGTHVVTIADGVIYDSWDSSGEYPVYFWEKR